MTGIMEAVAKGAKQSEKYYDGSLYWYFANLDPEISNKNILMW
jgi:hypothetical protein